MMENLENNENQENLPIKPDPLSLENWQEIKPEIKKYLMGKIGIKKKENEVFGFPQQRMRGGRPYFYLYWYQYINGRRVKHELYLGKELPKGMSFGKKVKIATGKNGEKVEAT